LQDYFESKNQAEDKGFRKVAPLRRTLSASAIGDRKLKTKQHARSRARQLVLQWGRKMEENDPSKDNL